MPTVITPTAGMSGNTSVQTSSGGAAYVALPDLPCTRVAVTNDTGTDIEFLQDGAGTSFPIKDGTTFSCFGLRNANQLSFRRKDVSTEQVTVKARWEV